VLVLPLEALHLAPKVLLVVLVRGSKNFSKASWLTLKVTRHLYVAHLLLYSLDFHVLNSFLSYLLA
jgi:hypothetical protein